MDKNELIVRTEDCIDDSNILELDDSLIQYFDKELASEVVNKFSHKVILMVLPESEVLFFEWLKKNDREVWNDLWETDDISERKYLVSLSFLPLLISEKQRGFPICDLKETDNYYFSMKHMVDAESSALIEASKKRFQNKEKMEIHHLLALEISVGAIDIWHFAYKYALNIEDAKKAVKMLVDDNALVHLTDAEHLAPLIDF